MKRTDAVLMPDELIARARALSRFGFVEEYGDTALLLVRLDDPEGELALGLQQASTVTGERATSFAEPMNYATVVGDPPHQRAPSSNTERPRAFSHFSLQKQLLARAHFAAPLRKRPIAGKPFSSRISVGRARNNDIVLRHESVSKFQAWFECADDGKLQLGDARSTNPTLLNGTRVGRELLNVNSGDLIQFGVVETTLCAAHIFWDAIHDSG